MVLRGTEIFDWDVNTVALYRLNKNALDEGGVHNGTLINSPTVSPGIKTKSYRMDGNLGGKRYISIPHHVDLTFGSNDFTVEAVFKYIATTGEVAQCIVGKTDSLGRSWRIQMRTSLQRLECYVVTNIGTKVAFDLTSPMSPNTWYYVAMVRDGNNLYSYLDGVQGSNVDDVTGETLVDSGAICTIGRLGTFDGYYVNGYVDEVRISNGLRSPNEIKRIYNKFSHLK